MPPELLTKHARDHITAALEGRKATAAQAIKLAIEMGVNDPELIRAQNLAEGFDENAPPDPNDPCPEDDKDLPEIDPEPEK